MSFHFENFTFTKRKEKNYCIFALILPMEMIFNNFYVLESELSI